MNTVPDAILEQVAHNLCSLHGFAPEFVAENEQFARAVIAEYLAASPRPQWRALIRDEDVQVGREGAVVCSALDRSPPYVAYLLDGAWFDAEGFPAFPIPTHYLDGAPIPAKPPIPRKARR